MRKEQNWYFTFGVGHYPYNKNYVKIYGTFKEAREKMVERFGTRWACQYDQYDQLKAEEFGLSLYTI